MDTRLNAPFICAAREKCELYQHVAAPYLRKDFTAADFQTAELYICGLGFYEVWLNGQRFTKGKLAPYISNPTHLVYYDRYDVTALLNNGKNALGVLLGNGFQNSIGGAPWQFEKAPWCSSPKLSYALYLDGVCVLSSAEPMRWAPSPVYFDEIRCGEYYDARREIHGWNLPDFDDSGWQDTLPADAPTGRRVLCEAEPIVCEKELRPVKWWYSDGGVMFDFGINTAGVCRIKCKGPAGQWIALWHCEALSENHGFYNKNTCTPDYDRFLSQKDILICSGGEDEFEPHFTYHGFRYVFAEGPGVREITDDFLTMRVLHSDLAETGSISCSDETVNRLQTLTRNSNFSNFFYFPTDCPQREKNGWTPDASQSAEQMLWNMDCAKSLRIWLDNIRLAQTEQGQLPGIIPTDTFGYAWGGGPTCDCIIIELPYQLYQFTGELAVLRENAGAIFRYVHYLKSKQNEKGMLSFGLGDWLEAGSPAEHLYSTPLEVVDTLATADMLRKAAFIFETLGMTAEQAECEDFREALLTRFRESYVVDGYRLTARTQTAQAGAIAAGVFAADYRQQAVEELVAIIAEDNNHFRTGGVGAHVLFRVLADNGYASLAYRLITQDGFPSFKYWLDHGATSLWEGMNEVFDGSVLRRDGGRVLSLNHHFWGDISAWFYRYIAGLNINPDGNDACFFEVRPCEITALSHAEATYRNKNGSICVAWKRNADGKPDISVSVTGKFRYRLAEK